MVHVVRRLTMAAWGGTETTVTELALALRARGVRSEICCTRALDDRAFEVLRDVPVRRFRHFYPFVVQSKTGRLKLDAKGGNPVSPGLLCYLLHCRADLFHVHAAGRLGATVRAAARARRLPYVVSLHGGLTEIPSSQLRALGRAPGMHLDMGRLLHPLLPQRRVLRDAAHVICVGAAEAKAIAKQYPDRRVSYVPNGVDTQRFASGDGSRFRARFEVQGSPLLLCPGRIDSQKNQLLAVRGLARIVKDRPLATLVFLGPVSESAYRQQLDAAITGLGLSRRTRFLAAVGYDDPLLCDAYAAADVVLLPSVHEPFGIVVLEAWAAGKPVVASAVGGLRALIEHDRTGLLFSSGDEEGLEDCLLRVLSQPALARRLAAAGREQAQTHYSWEAHAERTLEIYEAAVARGFTP